MSATTLFLVALAVGMLLVVWLVAADRQRYLARFDLGNWRDQDYLKSLPNFLQALHDYNFTSAWPATRNAVAAHYFGYRVRPILKARRGVNRRSFLFQHLNLHAQLEILRPYIRDAIMAAQLRIVTDRVLSMEDTSDRDRLLDFISRMRTYRAAFDESLTPYDRRTISLMNRRRFIETLRQVQAVCQEHGFILLPEFSALRRWELLSGSELAQELPPLPRDQVLRQAMRRTPTPRANRNGVRFGLR